MSQRVEGGGRSARPAPRRQVGLRFVLLTLLFGMVLGTVGLIGVVAFLTTSQAIDGLEARFFSLASSLISREVRAVVEPAQPLLEGLRAEAGRGLLPVDEPDRLGNYLVERLRYQPRQRWLAYADASRGWLVAASRRLDGSMVVEIDRPGPGRPPADDPRDQVWYRRAAESDRLVWSGPTVLEGERSGPRASLALREPGSAAVRGVFGVEAALDSLSAGLAEFIQTRRRGLGRMAVLTAGGEVIAASYPAGDGLSTAIVQSAARVMPQPAAGLTGGEPARLTVEQAGTRYIAAFQTIQAALGPDWVGLVVVPEADFRGVVYDNARLTGLVGLGALALALALGSLLAGWIAAPLRALARDLEQVGRFQLTEGSAPPSPIGELSVVGDAVDRMKASLRSFGHYVPIGIVRELLASGREAELGGQPGELTVLFTDVEGFTSLGETMEPTELVRHLGSYFEAVTRAVERNEGTVDKFVGDGVMAFFNAPGPVAGHAGKACLAALQAQSEMAALREAWERLGKPALRFRVGLHTGPAVVGNVGTPERFGYTAIGDTVNLASRLEQLNKTYGTLILASQQTRAAAGAGFEWRTLDRVAVPGRQEATLVSELLGERGRLEPAVLAARDRYEAALADYLDGRYEQAAERFRAAAAAQPADRAAALLAERAKTLVQRSAAMGQDG